MPKKLSGPGGPKMIPMLPTGMPMTKNTQTFGTKPTKKSK